MNQEFYKNWKRKTKLEETTIKTLKAVKKRILKEIPKEKIHSIYVKGSFPRREMNKKSDLDLVAIVNDNKDIKFVKKFYKKYRYSYTPEINLGVLSLWELKNNKRRYKSKKPQARPYLFIKHLRIYKLIYGKAINPEDYILKDSKIYLKNRIKTFYELFLPLHRKKEFGFGELIKQVFWLIEVEQEAKGKKAPNSWKALDKSIKEKNHIIHNTYKYRKKPTKDKKLRAKYIKDLRFYLIKLKKEVK